MIYILDTNVISQLRRPERAPHIASWLAARDETSLFLSVVTIGEIERGIVLQKERDPAFARDLRNWLDRTIRIFSDRIIPFTPEDALRWGGLSARIGHAGADLMIAAQALGRDATVVTRNVADFVPTGARILDPSIRAEDNGA